MSKELKSDIVIVHFQPSVVAEMRRRQSEVGICISEQVRRAVAAALKAESGK
jgi:hypothetical protein